MLGSIFRSNRHCGNFSPLFPQLNCTTLAKHTQSEDGALWWPGIVRKSTSFSRTIPFFSATNRIHTPRFESWMKAQLVSYAKDQNCQAICERFPPLFLVYQHLAGAKTAMLIRNKPLFLRNKGHFSENNGDFLGNKGHFSESKGLFLHEKTAWTQTVGTLH